MRHRVETDFPIFEMPVPTVEGSGSIHWGQLYGSAQGLAVSDVLAKHHGSVCVITASAAAADRLERELNFFAPENGARRFSDYETLPYDAFSPPQDLLAERLSSLYHLTIGAQGILIVNA